MNIEQITAFNPTYYLNKYPDVRNDRWAGANPYQHYKNNGAGEGRFANQNFEQSFNNSKKKGNPVVIFNQTGFKGEGIMLAEGPHNAINYAMNDNVISIKVQKGYAVVLTEDINRDGSLGKKKVITEDTDNIFDFGVTIIYVLKINPQIINIPKGSLPKGYLYDEDTPNWFDENFYIAQSADLQLLYSIGMLSAGQAYHHWYHNAQGKIPPNIKNEYPALIMPYLPAGAWNVPKVRANRLDIMDIINKIKWTNKNNGQIGIDNFNVPNFYTQEQSFDFSSYEILEFTNSAYSTQKRCGSEPDCEWSLPSWKCDDRRRPYFDCKRNLEDVIRRIEAVSEREKAWFIEKEQALAKLTAEKIITNLPSTDNTKAPTLNQKPNYTLYGVLAVVMVVGGFLAYKTYQNNQE